MADGRTDLARGICRSRPPCCAGSGHGRPARRAGHSGPALVLVDRDRILLSRTYGVVDRDTREPFGPEPLPGVGSITKTFTALAVLRLVREGRWR
ncbi:MAG: serine hydrolase [Woeseiaceae bacterium]|nr:serine hydrolase [Woeseiaceae bacterium]